MKKSIIVSLVLVAMLSVFGFTASAQKTTIEIKTSAVCGTCKSSIEKALKSTSGVKSAKLDVKTKVVTVTYDAGKTDPAKIREAISKVGYDADDVKADPAAYSKLHECCKKEGHE